MPEQNAASQAPSARPQGADRPRVVGDFELLDRIGQGAMGTVFKARQRSMDRTVAVKVLLPRLADDAAYVERFFREARAAARLNHPNIVLALTVGEDQGCYYFAMEYVEGHTVAMLLKAGPLEERQALEIALQVARALDYAWSQERIVHRDIKPGNILITPGGTAKLADLGLAHEATLGDDGATEAEGKIMGTPFYIAPEQILRRADLDVRCDLYALGATLFHMVTGRPPFKGRSTKAILANQLHKAAPDPRELRPELSDSVAYVLQRLLAKEREERYPDAKALVADIEAALRGEAVGPRHAPAPRIRRAAPRRQGTASAVLASVVILALIGVAVAILADRMRSEAPRQPEGPKAPPTPADAHLAAADQAWNEAESYADGHPADLPGAIARLRQVERQFHDTPFRERAAARRVRLEADLERKSQEALRGLVERAEALVREARYADALALFQELPPSLAAAEGWRGRAAAAKAAIERQAGEAFKAALARGDALAERGELDAALRAYEAAAPRSGASLPDAWGTEAAARIEGVRRRQKALADRARAEAEAAQFRLLGELLDLYRARKYDEAAEFLKARLAASAAERMLAEQRAELEAELAEVAKLKEFWARAELGAQNTIGQPFAIRGIQGELAAVKNGRLTITTRGGSFSEELRNLGTDQILGLGLSSYTSVAAPLAAARLLLAEGNADAAEGRLKAAGRGGPELAALRARLGRVQAAGIFAAATREFRGAQALLAAGDAESAAKVLSAFLRRYGAQPAAASPCYEAQRLLAQATATKTPQWGYIGGKAAARPDADVRNTHDRAIYLTERHGLRAYRIPVANGAYLVRLHFAETSPRVTGVGQRIFSVAIEGRPALTDFDVFKEAGRQRFAALIMEFDVAVQDDELTIEFTPKAQSPAINGIEVVPRAPGTKREAVLINCGASQDYVAKDGRIWKKDQEYQAP